MKFTVLTLFPEIIDAYFASSIMAKAMRRGIIQYQPVNIRDFALDKHKTCDDAPYGGGAGMLMLPEVLGSAIKTVLNISHGGTEARRVEPDSQTSVFPSCLCAFVRGIRSRSQCAFVRDIRENDCPLWGVGANRAAGCTGGGAGKNRWFLPRSFAPSRQGTEPCEVPRGAKLQPSNLQKPRVIYLTPSGKIFDQARAKELAGERELVLVCGRYEGIDQRVIDRYIDDEICVGDYVLSSGEVAALALIDAVYRLVDDVITPESLKEESFSDGLLEYPQYTRPEIYDTLKVPDVLLSGHHENIRKWRLEKRVEKTLKNRPDLIRRGRELGTFSGEVNSLVEQALAKSQDTKNKVLSEGDTNDE